MKLKFNKIRSGILPNGWLWICKDEMNLSGSGPTREAALGDYLLGYRDITKVNDTEYELEIKVE